MVERSVEVLAKGWVKIVTLETFSKRLWIIVVEKIFCTFHLYSCTHQSKFYLEQILRRENETDIYGNKVQNISF